VNIEEEAKMKLKREIKLFNGSNWTIKHKEQREMRADLLLKLREQNRQHNK